MRITPRPEAPGPGPGILRWKVDVTMDAVAVAPLRQLDIQAVQERLPAASMVPAVQIPLTTSRDRRHGLPAQSGFSTSFTRRSGQTAAGNRHLPGHPFHEVQDLPHQSAVTTGLMRKKGAGERSLSCLSAVPGGSIGLFQEQDRPQGGVRGDTCGRPRGSRSRGRGTDPASAGRSRGRRRGSPLFPKHRRHGRFARLRVPTNSSPCRSPPSGRMQETGCDREGAGPGGSGRRKEGQRMHHHSGILPRLDCKCSPAVVVVEHRHAMQGRVARGGEMPR